MLRKFKKTSIVMVIAGLVVGVLHIDSAVFATVPGTNQLASVRSVGGFANSSSGGSLISANGKIVVYNTVATNIVPSGGLGVFLRNLAAGTIERVNVSTSGVIANDGQGTTAVKVSATGRYVVLRSTASNLIDGTTIPTAPSQLYLRDTVADTTVLISKTSTGTLSNGGMIDPLGVSSDGRFIAFATNASNLHVDSTDGTLHLYMLDRLDGSLIIVDRKTDGTVGNTTSTWPPQGSMSCDGSILAFQYASNLILSDPSSGHANIYILDRRGVTDKLTNITRTASSAASGPSVSCNGDYVGFKTRATNLDPTLVVSGGWIRPYVYDRVNASHHLASVTTTGVSTSTDICGTFMDASPCIQISDMGLSVFAANNFALAGFAGEQLYMRDIHTGSTELLSKTSSGAGANGVYRIWSPNISADGRTAVYSSDASNLIAGDPNVYTDIITSLTGY